MDLSPADASHAGSATCAPRLGPAAGGVSIHPSSRLQNRNPASRNEMPSPSGLRVRRVTNTRGGGDRCTGELTAVRAQEQPQYAHKRTTPRRKLIAQSSCQRGMHEHCTQHTVVSCWRVSDSGAVWCVCLRTCERALQQIEHTTHRDTIASAMAICADAFQLVFPHPTLQ